MVEKAKKEIEEAKKEIEKTKKEAKQEIAINLLNQGIDVKIISEATGLTKEQIEELK